MRVAHLGVLLEKKSAERRWKYGINVFENYIGEILSHLCIPHFWIDDINKIKGLNPDIIIVALYEENEQSDTMLLNFTENGGVLISYAGLNHMASRLGFKETKSLSSGYAQLPSSKEDNLFLRFLYARPWIKSDGLELDSITRSGIIHKEQPLGDIIGEAALRLAYGKGRIERWSIDIPRTVVEFQQGSRPVVEDGVPAGDGTGNVDEGILKADDQSEMDWEYDRQRTVTGASYYAQPYADLWREEMIGHLLRCSLELGLTLPFVGYWPDGISNVALISHDSDINLNEHAESTLELLAECGLKTTWCMLEPGYSTTIYEKVKEQGHELALHYNALEEDEGRWGEAEFSNQCRWMKQATGIDTIITNKNHYTRFEGWGELFGWCEQNNIQVDQTRGPSKKGNIGFLFGTCHPYFPISNFIEKNRIYDVLEVGFLTQDIDHPLLTDSSVIEPFLEKVLRVRGIAHFLFHQIHIHNFESVRNALRKVVIEARSRGFVFWTSSQINHWERERRCVVIQGIDENGIPIVQTKKKQIAALVVYVPTTKETLETAGTTEVLFGVKCMRIVM